MTSETNAANEWKFWGTVAAIVTGVVTFFLPGGEHLLLGWLYFPLRTLPRMTVDWPAALLGLAALIGFVVGLHVAIRGFMSAASPTLSVQWSWRSTIAISLTLQVMFAAGIAVVGAAHQLVWLTVGHAAQMREKGEAVYGLTNAVRSSAHRTSESNKLKNLTLNIQNFHDVFQALPPGGTMTENGELLHGWAIQGGAAFMYYAEAVDFSIPWNKPPNDRVYKCNLWPFVNPALQGPYFDEHGFGLGHIAGNVHVLPIRTLKAAEFNDDDRKDGPMRLLHKTNQSFDMKNITDGTSNTILLGTVTQRFKPWGHPANVRDPGRGIDRSPDGFGGPPQWGGAMFSFCDGHTAVLNRKIDPKVLRALATPAGGEPIPNY
jgi:prepilin-type processing-associated H-X9-DG protein